MRYYLVVYSRGSGQLLVEQEYSSRDEALAARFRLERGRRDDPDTEVVVLGAASAEALRRTHARYFSSVDELAGAVDV
jgi:hypothetical protein